MTVRQTVECDSYHCNATLDIDPADGVDSAMSYADWGENPENGWEHFCVDCLPGVLKKYEEGQEGE